MTVAEANLEAPPAIGLQRQTAVIDQRGFGDGSVTLTIGKFENQRRRDPFPGAYLGDLTIRVDAFVVPAEIVMPHGAVAGNNERRRFIGNPRVLGRGNNESKGSRIVENADVQHVSRAAPLVVEREFCAVAMICGTGVNAVPRIALFNL